MRRCSYAGPSYIYTGSYEYNKCSIYNQKQYNTYT